MTNISLPMYNPIINTYNIYGSISSILSIDEKLMPWMYDNFIQIKYVYEWDSYFFDNHHILMDNIPWINHHLIPRDILTKKWDSLKDFVVESLNSGYYVYLFVDRFHVSVSEQYRKVKLWHEIFIYGYDEDKQEFLIADNLAHGKYIKTVCPTVEIEKAYFNVVSENQFFQNVHLLSKNEKGEYPLKIHQIIESIYRYLHSFISMDLSFKEESLFGLKAVQYSIEKEKSKLDSCIPIKLDKRAFHLFWEHKKLMHRRLRYLMNMLILKQNDEMLQCYEKIVDCHELLRNMVLKFNLKNDRDLFFRIEKRLAVSIQLETEILNEVLIELQSLNVSDD